MKLVYACTLTSFVLAAALRFGSCQDHKQDLCNTRPGTLGRPETAGAIVSKSLQHEMLEKGLPISFVYGCTSTSSAALRFGSWLFGHGRKANSSINPWPWAWCVSASLPNL